MVSRASSVPNECGSVLASWQFILLLVYLDLDFMCKLNILVNCANFPNFWLHCK